MYSPIHVRQSSSRDLCKIAKAHGMFAKEGNGNDIEECYQLAKEAVDFINGGSGPAFIKLNTYRYREHCGPNYDTDLDYRTLDEFNDWKAKCPVKMTQKKLMDENLLTEDELTKMKTTIQEEIDEAFVFAKSSPLPEFDLDFEKVYAE